MIVDPFLTNAVIVYDMAEMRVRRMIVPDRDVLLDRSAVGDGEAVVLVGLANYWNNLDAVLSGLGLTL